jgi:geranylgeranyl diphosphate synthase, type I
MSIRFDERVGNTASSWERNPLTAFYPLIRARMAELTPAGWPDLAREIERHVTLYNFPPAVLLPIVTCATAGGTPRRAVSSAAAISFILLCARWLDDAVDRDRSDGLWSTVGPERSILFGASALALAFQAVAGDPNTPREAAESLARYSVAMARGQDIDVTGKARSFDEYWELMRGKTGAGFALACEIGAISAGAETAVAHAFGEFGMHLGVLLQILDDLEGCFRPKGIADLRQGKVTLPVVYALAIDHAGRGELEALVGSGDLGQHSARATEILESAGAREYAIWAALEERKRALGILKRLSRPGNETTRAGQNALASFLELPFHGLPEIS